MHFFAPGIKYFRILQFYTFFLFHNANMDRFLFKYCDAYMNVSHTLPYLLVADKYQLVSLSDACSISYFSEKPRNHLSESVDFLH